MKYFFYIISSIALLSMLACTKNSSTLEDESTFVQKINLHTITTDSLLKIAQELPAMFSQNAQTKSSAKVIKEVIPFNHFIPKTKSSTTGSTTDLSESIYVVNYDNEEGFAILSADDRMPQLLGYSDQGNITDSIDNPGLQIVMNNISCYAANSSRAIIDDPLPPTDTIGYDTITTVSSWTGIPTGPFLSTKWDQDYPLNEKAPMCTSHPEPHHMPAGCGALAATMVASYYKYPYYIGLTEIDWDTINAKTYAYTLQVKYANQLAEVSATMASASNSSYGCSETSVSHGGIADALKYFNYTMSESRYDNDYVRTSIQNGKIVLITAYEDEGIFGWVNYGGHSWVIDGYVTQSRDWVCTVNAYNTISGKEISSEYLWSNTEYRYLVHCNFGWGGEANGWYENGIFETSAPVISDQGSTATQDSHHYHCDMSILYNITPPANI